MPESRCVHEEFALSYYRACPDDPSKAELCVSFDNQLRIIPASSKKLMHDLKTIIELLPND